MIGRKLAISRHYTMWDSVMPDNLQIWSSRAGRTPYVARHAVKRNGTAVTWSSIASGAQDQTIRSVARALAVAGRCISASTTNRRTTLVAERRRTSSQHTTTCAPCSGPKASRT